MRFSIVVPAYNYGSLVERAVASACLQSGEDFEVVVIDDGSTDNTPEVLDRLEARYATLRVLRQKNAGASAARNKGVNEARGDFILFLDADDELLPNALAAFREAIENQPQVDVLVGRTLSVFDSGEERESPVPRLSDDPEQRFLDYLYKKLRMSNGAVLTRRELLVAHPFNPELRQTEDIPVFSQCLAAGQCAVLPFVVVKIFKHDDSRRHGAEAALSVGMQLVDEIFDPSRLPSDLMIHKERYRARRGVSLFRLLYRAGRFREARAFYREAVKADWREAVAKPENIIKYLRSLLG